MKEKTGVWTLLGAILTTSVDLTAAEGLTQKKATIVEEALREGNEISREIESSLGEETDRGFRELILPWVVKGVPIEMILSRGKKLSLVSEEEARRLSPLLMHLGAKLSLQISTRDNRDWKEVVEEQATWIFYRLHPTAYQRQMLTLRKTQFLSLSKYSKETIATHLANVEKRGVLLFDSHGNLRGVEGADPSCQEKLRSDK